DRGFVYANTQAGRQLALATGVLAGMVARAAATAPALGRCPSDRPEKFGIPIALASRNTTTYYVRTDGGDASQCTGRADAPYPGSGKGRACAWKNPDIALPTSGGPRITGGDTLRIAAGTYPVGDGGYMQPIPSGSSATSPTRILGKPGALPKLVGINGIHRVLNLDGSSNVEVGNLEITDG